MANRYLSKEAQLSVSHLPTFILAIGYIVFWLELYFLPSQNGVTSPLATILFLLVLIYIVSKNFAGISQSLKNFKANFGQESLITRIFLICGAGLSLLIVGCAFYAAVLPPHLMQEYDSLNYHLTIPRQHLILHSFQHIPWSHADLFPLPIDFALAPYWFVTQLPNKFPQFIFFLGLICVSIRLVKRFNQNHFLSLGLMAFAIFGSHGIGIQLGTAMLDLVLAYLFLAALDSFLSGAVVVAAIEFTFYFWAKAFVPIQIIVIFLVVTFLIWLLKRFGFNRMAWTFNDVINSEAKVVYLKRVKRFLSFFVLFSLFVGGPFVTKSLSVAGTPLFPFSPGLIKINNHIGDNSKAWNSLVGSVTEHMKVKDSYGYGRSAVDFMKHFWLLAVPDKSVNNRFDYPMGLIYLLFLGPFVYFFFKSFWAKEISILSFFIMTFWLSWWFGSQQSRFLYIPILLMYILVLSNIKIFSPLLMSAVLLALFLNFISILGAHKNDFFKSPLTVLREKDTETLTMNQSYLQEGRKDYVYLEYHDVPYAQFPVIVTKEKFPYVLAF